MTQPPEGPGAHEPTRRLDPQDDQPTQAYSEPAQPYEQSVPYEQPSTQYQPEQGGYYDGPYTQAQPYTQGHYDQGQPYQQPPAPAKHTGRTIGLSLAIVLALIVIAFVGYRIVDGNGSSSDTTAATSSETTAAESTTVESTTETTTEPTEETTTTDSVPAGQVTYQITGNGDLVGLRYATGSGVQFLAAVGAPWQQTTTVTGTTAELSAIVISGKLTCSISRGDTVLSTSTSAGGTLNCSATLPSE